MAKDSALFQAVNGFKIFMTDIPITGEFFTVKKPATFAEVIFDKLGILGLQRIKVSHIIVYHQITLSYIGPFSYRLTFYISILVFLLWYKNFQCILQFFPLNTSFTGLSKNKMQF